MALTLCDRRHLHARVQGPAQSEEEDDELPEQEASGPVAGTSSKQAPPAGSSARKNKSRKSKKKAKKAGAGNAEASQKAAPDDVDAALKELNIDVVRCHLHLCHAAHVYSAIHCRHAAGQCRGHGVVCIVSDAAYSLQYGLYTALLRYARGSLTSRVATERFLYVRSNSGCICRGELSTRYLSAHHIRHVTVAN